MGDGPARAAEDAEAVATLTDLLRGLPEDLYPPELRWRAQAERLLDPAVLDSPLVRVAVVPERGPVLFPGDRIARGSVELEVGQVVTRDKELAFGLVTPRGVTFNELKAFAVLRDGYGLDDDEDPGFRWVDGAAPMAIPTAGFERDLGANPAPWRALPPATQERLWPALAVPATIVGNFYDWSPIPAERAGKLLLLGQDEDYSRYNRRTYTLPPGASLIPPTPSGWLRFQALVPDARDPKGKPMKVTDARYAARFWWGWDLPRNVRPAGAEDGG